MAIARKWWPWLVSVAAALGYGLLMHLFARDKNSDGYAVMSMGYVFFLPTAMGVFSVVLAPEPQRKSWWYRCLAPLGTATVALLAAFGVGWEGYICLLMGAVIGLPLALLGGIVAGLSEDFSRRKGRQLCMVIALVAPGGSAWMEEKWDLPLDYREA